jgi:hypothetical protein
VAARNVASEWLLNSHQPLTAESPARITSGIVIEGGDSCAAEPAPPCAWCAASSGIRVGPVKVMNTARNV